MAKILYVNGDSNTVGMELDGARERTYKEYFRISEYQRVNCYGGVVARELGFDEFVQDGVLGCSVDRIFRRTVIRVTELLQTHPSSDIFVLLGIADPSRREFFYQGCDGFVQFMRGHISGKKMPDLRHMWDLYYNGGFDGVAGGAERFLAQMISLQSFLNDREVPYLITHNTLINRE